MSRKWGKRQWYEYHKGKAAEAGVKTYAATEKNALDAIDIKIADLEREQRRLYSTLSGWLGILSIFIPNETTRAISEIRRRMEELRAHRALLHFSSHEKITRAASLGINQYHLKREVDAQEKAVAAQERRIRYLERSPAIRSAQSAIKEHLIAMNLEYGEIVCYYCNVSLEPEAVHIEHKLPVSRGGTNSRKNLVLACASCNLRKGTKTEPEFRRYLENNND
jgi:5-methylcytosine-specific restriction endonuclease McrA